MRSKVLMSMLVIALAAALVGGATMAWFTDSAETDDVTVQAGTLMIDVDDLGDAENVDTDFATLDRLNPGDCWEWEFDVHNIGTKSANWLLYMCWNDTVGQENEDLNDEGVSEEQKQTQRLKDKNYGDSALSEVLNWTVTVTTGDGDDATEKQYEITKLSGSPHLVFGKGEKDEFSVPGEDGEENVRHVTVTACFPAKDDNKDIDNNAYQGAKMDLAFGVRAWQTTNEAPAPTAADIKCPWDSEDDED